MVTSGHIRSTNISGTRPNFIASEVGLLQKTRQIVKDPSAVPDDANRIIVKGGSLYKNADDVAEGIVYEDVDVTNGDMEGSVIIAGRVLLERLSEPADFTAEIQEALTKNGLYFDHAPEVTRP